MLSLWNNPGTSFCFKRKGTPKYWIPRYIPRKVGRELAWGLFDSEPPRGWGFCIEDHFDIPLYIQELINLILLGGQFFTIVQVIEHGSSGPDTALYVFTVASFFGIQWIGRMDAESIIRWYQLTWINVLGIGIMAVAMAWPTGLLAAVYMFAMVCLYFVQEVMITWG
jgi:hypothetical protein